MDRPDRKKVVLPTFTVTELANENDEGTVRIDLANRFTLPDGKIVTHYYVRPKQWLRHQFNLLPVVLGSDGIPWAEANIYLLSKLQAWDYPNMKTYEGYADDLASYRRFLDNYGIDWMHFPENIQKRPTHRYNGHLKNAVYAGEIGQSTAKKRMGTVISFYRHLMKEGALIPEHAPWSEKYIYVEIKRAYGGSTLKRVTTTNVSIHVAKQDDPYAGTINDGGQLRPLPHKEQEWLMDALTAQGNTEMTLIHLVGIWTGARIQTILTLKVRHVWPEAEDSPDGEVVIPAGPGTGIDTKHDKQLTLHFPVWLYQMLHTYAHSDRAKKRRERAIGGDTEDQYLFLSIRGTPLYLNKLDSRDFNKSNTRRHTKTGQSVRQFITEYIIPFIRAKYNQPKYHYRFHDTRATFGMNLTDNRIKLVESGKMTLSEVREFVKNRMGHDSAATTDLYLNYRKNIKLAMQVNDQYTNHLKALSEKAMTGLL